MHLERLTVHTGSDGPLPAGWLVWASFLATTTVIVRWTEEIVEIIRAHGEPRIASCHDCRKERRNRRRHYILSLFGQHMKGFFFSAKMEAIPVDRILLKK
jgi:hypothetical protein